MFGLFKKVVEPVVQVIQVESPKSEFRQGMWVMTDEGVGIVTGDSVTLVKEDGTTKLTLVEDKAVPHVVEKANRQALIAEIPESRRPPVDNVFGYV